ncbi:hypothetical protein D030_2428B, partial [Vibrio parahaemolyticus AQ3810]
ALGFHDLIKGTATATAPNPPTTAVVAVRKRLRPLFKGALLIQTFSHLLPLDRYYSAYKSMANK